jgi:hypothetical protein
MMAYTVLEAYTVLDGSTKTLKKIGYYGSLWTMVECGLGEKNFG